MPGFGHIHNLEVASMYIDKRWLVPAGLSLLLVGAFFAGVLLLLGSRFAQVPGSAHPAQITSVEGQSGAPRAAVESASTSAPLPTVTAATDAAPAPDVVPAAAGGSQRVTPTLEEAVGIATTGSGATQINTRGFGDIGLQWQDVNINGPVTMVHVSNQGNNNTTNVNTAPNGRIVSSQERLQSNRSDANPPPPPASVTAARTTGPANAQAAPRAGRGAGPRTHQPHVH